MQIKKNTCNIHKHQNDIVGITKGSNQLSEVYKVSFHGKRLIAASSGLKQVYQTRCLCGCQWWVWWRVLRAKDSQWDHDKQHATNRQGVIYNSLSFFSFFFFLVQQHHSCVTLTGLQKTEWGSCLVIMCFEAFVYDAAKMCKAVQGNGLKCSLVELDKRPMKRIALSCSGFYYAESDSPCKTQNPDVRMYSNRRPPFVNLSHWCSHHRPHQTKISDRVKVTGSLWHITSMAYILLAQP